MKGIILAGGKGSRLYPLTLGMSKQMLPVYDKPMIYYPLSILMLAGIRDILVISSPDDLPLFRRLLGTGERWGIQFSYIEQKKPAGLADAFLIGAEFIGDDQVCLILGDNIFFGTGLWKELSEAAKLTEGAQIFAYRVREPQSYGVVEFDSNGKVISLEEKPEHPKSNFVVPGLYFYDNRVIDIAQKLEPSVRNELEITDLNQVYLELGQLSVRQLGRGVAWLDAGTHETLLQAANYIQAVEERQGLMIGSPEEVAYRMGFIEREQLIELATSLRQNGYGDYLLALAHDA